MTPAEALRGYADPIVWLVLCAFFIVARRAEDRPGTPHRVSVHPGVRQSLARPGYALVVDRCAAGLDRAVEQRRARAAIIFPIARSLAEAYDSTPGPTARPARRVPDDDGLSVRRRRLRDVPDRPGVQRAHREVRARDERDRADLRRRGSSAVSCQASSRCCSCRGCSSGSTRPKSSIRRTRRSSRAAGARPHGADVARRALMLVVFVLVARPLDHDGLAPHPLRRGRAARRERSAADAGARLGRRYWPSARRGMSSSGTAGSCAWPKR